MLGEERDAAFFQFDLFRFPVRFRIGSADEVVGGLHFGRLDRVVVAALQVVIGVHNRIEGFYLPFLEFFIGQHAGNVGNNGNVFVVLGDQRNRDPVGDRAGQADAEDVVFIKYLFLHL